MSLSGIFDPAVRAYFQNLFGDSGGDGDTENEGNIKVFDLLYKNGPAAEVEGLGTVHYIGKNEPQIETHNYILELFVEDSTQISYIGASDIMFNDYIWSIMKDGAVFLLHFAENDVLMPSDIGLPEFGLYLGASFVDRPFAILSYNSEDVT